MIVNNYISDLFTKVREIVHALANRLTAEDNFGPEGELGQFLGSNGPTIPPSYKDIAGTISGDPDLVETIRGPAGPIGPTGPAGEDGEIGPEGPAGFMPLTVGVGETFIVPTNRQGLFAKPIIVDGVLVVSGDLIQVD